MKPGEQKPHWAPPWTIQASCRACRFCGEPTPSMVVTCAQSATRLNLVTHERTTLPSSNTEQHPHCPWSQPILVPVRPSCDLSTVASEASPSATTIRGTPLTTTVFFCTTHPFHDSLVT